MGITWESLALALVVLAFVIESRKVGRKEDCDKKVERQVGRGNYIGG